MANEFRVGGVAAMAVALVSLAGCSVERSGSGASDAAQDGTSVGSEASPQAPDGGSAGSEWVPGAGNEDPSKDIEGIVITEYDAVHALPGQRVAYEKAPPDGGRHDPVWATCNGVVYDTPVRNEHMVHALEHGAVWIAYNADDVTGDDLDTLTGLVENQPYLLMSPYPGLDRPISLQAWGHQLKLDDVDDERIGQFITALRENEYTSPEPGASCDSAGPGFDTTNPPAFEEGPPGPGAAPVGDN
ncbi:DUF3105 domain-containing protein [Actinophytocola algeriensis]|uniref:DUF3105 domain-containing protein n=1 Tax=Actinophytocola algeriensis TaxID=1768010 RepID=A0A7W7Q6Y1_9PSEU|nr:DUF3105 domain-containing protein [Actinophytocola algeriensis]MBB4907998.1 hypothetical protein [Actinophytocola algeriensis]MBE1480028.1 hypothetical protein [Actinophytocola algeriensis]